MDQCSSDAYSTKILNNFYTYIIVIPDNMLVMYNLQPLYRAVFVIKLHIGLL